MAEADFDFYETSDNEYYVNFYSGNYIIGMSGTKFGDLAPLFDRLHKK